MFGHSLNLSRPFVVLGWLLLVAWTCASLAPVGIALLASVKDTTSIIADPLGLPQRILLENFTRAWGGTSMTQPLWVYASNSVIASVIALAVGISAGATTGYALARNRSRATELANRYFILLIALPPVVAWIPLFSLVNAMGLISSPVAIGLVYSAFVIPIATVMMRAYFVSFPLDLIEAAKVDGAGEWQIFGRVVIPLSLGALGAVILVQLIYVWNELGLALILLIQPGSRTLPVGLAQFRGQDSSDFGAQFAALLLSILPILVVYALFQKRLTEGMRLGAFR